MATDDKIVQFCGISGADPTVAKEFLQATNGNVEQAVSRYFENPNPASVAAPGGAPQQASGMNPLTGSPAVRAPMQAQYDTLVGGSQPMFGGFGGLFGGAAAPRAREPFRDYSKEWGKSAGPSNKKAATLQAMFAAPSYSFRGTFEECCEKSEREHKWILVNIQSVQEFTSHILNRDVWKDDTIKAIIEANFTLFQFENDTPEGQKYCQYYHVGKFPHLAIVDPRTRQEKENFSSKTSKTKVQEVLFNFIENNSMVAPRKTMPPPAPIPVAMVAQNPAPSSGPAASSAMDHSNLTEEQQLAMAIAQSLAEEKKEEQDTSLSSKPANNNSSVSSSAAGTKSQSNDMEQSVPPAAIEVVEEPPKGAPDSTRVSVRLVDGTRRQRRFLLSHRLQDLHNYCASEMDGKADFDFHVPFPRMIMSRNDADKMGKSLKELGLRNCNLICKSE